MSGDKTGWEGESAPPKMTSNPRANRSETHVERESSVVAAFGAVQLSTTPRVNRSEELQYEKAFAISKDLLALPVEDRLSRGSLINHPGAGRLFPNL